LIHFNVWHIAVGQEFLAVNFNRRMNFQFTEVVQSKPFIRHCGKLAVSTSLIQ